MTVRTVAHDTIVLERRYPHAPDRVFALWSDSEARQRWESPMSSMTMRYENFDFRVGGREVSYCGPPGEDLYRFDVRYEDIVPNTRIVFASRNDAGEIRMAASLVTVEFLEESAGTHLIVTDQVAVYDGHHEPGDHAEGWGLILDSLGRELERFA